MATQADYERLSKYATELYGRMSEVEKQIAVQGESDRHAERNAERAIEQLTAIGAVLSEIRSQGAENAEQLRHLAERVSALEIPRAPARSKSGPWGTIRDLFGRWTPASLIVAVIVCVGAAYVFLEESITELIAASKTAPPD